MLALLMPMARAVLVMLWVMYQWRRRGSMNWLSKSPTPAAKVLLPAQGETPHLARSSSASGPMRLVRATTRFSRMRFSNGVPGGCTSKSRMERWRRRSICRVSGSRTMTS